MHSRGIRCTLATVFLLLFVAVPHLPAAAQRPSSTAYTGMDVVILVDQSGSMGGKYSGSKTHPEPNDLYGWRFSILLEAVHRLGEPLYQTYPDATVRLAVVEFGTAAELVDPPGIVTIEAKSEADWLPQKNDLLKKYQQYKDKRKTQHIGDTNHIAAFRMARRVFDQMNKADDSPRIKVLFLVTDGRPCIKYVVDPKTGEEDCRPWQPHLEELRDQVIPQYFPADYRIYVICINDSDDNYWPDTRAYWEAIAKAHGGWAKKISGLEDLGSLLAGTFAKEFSGLPRPVTKLPPVPIIPERAQEFYPVRPYLQIITFLIYKSVPADWIGLEEVGVPLDVTQSSADGRITVTGNDPDHMYGQIVVRQPQPGQWRIKKPQGSNVIIEVQGILFNPQLKSPVGEQPRGVPTRVELNLVDESGEFVPKYSNPLYDLDVTAAMRTTQGESKLDLAKEKPGVYAGLFLPRTQSQHTIHLLATSHDPTGKAITIIDQDAGTFTVGPLVVEFDSPKGDVYQHVPFRLAYRFLDSQGKAIKITTDPKVFTVRATISGEDVSKSITLTQEASGAYAAECVAAKSGPHQVHLVVAVQEGPNRETIIQEEDKGTFNVKPTTGMRYVVTQPQDKAQEFIRPWWLFPTLPLAVEVRLEDAGGKALAFDQAIQGAPEQAFTLRVKDPTGRDRSAEFAWSKTGAPGVLRAESWSTDLGEWTVEVTPTFTLRPGYALLNRDPTRLTVVRTEHYLAWGLDGLLVLVLAALAGVSVVRYRAVRRAPLLTGSLYIRNEGGAIIWKRSLTVRRNRLGFSGKALPVATCLKRLDVKRAPGKEEAIEISARLDNKTLIPSSRMVPGSRRQLGGYKLWLCYERD